MPVGAEGPEGGAHEQAIHHGEGEAHSIVTGVAPVADGALAQQHAVLPEQALRVLGLEGERLRAGLRLAQPVHQPCDVPARMRASLRLADLQLIHSQALMSCRAARCGINGRLQLASDACRTRLSLEALKLQVNR